MAERCRHEWHDGGLIRELSGMCVKCHAIRFWLNGQPNGPIYLREQRPDDGSPKLAGADSGRSGDKEE